MVPFQKSRGKITHAVGLVICGHVLVCTKDAANAILTAAGYNFRLVLAWSRELFLLILTAILIGHERQPAFKSTS